MATPADNDILALLIIAAVTSGIWLWLLVRVRSSYYRMVLFSSYALRMVVLWWDRYGSSIFVLPNVGGDSDLFHNRALLLLSSREFTGRLGSYPQIIASLYRFIGPQRMLAQYLNVLLSIASILILIRTLQELGVKDITVRRATLVAAFFPQGVILSAILLRESLIVYLITTSLYLYCRWHTGKGWENAVLAVASVSYAAMFHSGVVGMLPVYAFMFTFYSPSDRNLRISHTSAVIAMVTLMASTYLSLNPKATEIYLSHLTARELYQTINYSAGESVYLKSLTTNSLVEIVLHTPLRLFYFLFSPLPWRWRGPVDILTFCLDSTVYLASSTIILKYAWRTNRDRWLVRTLILIVSLVSITFAFGTNNAGTALRHRNKMMLGFVCLAALVSDTRPSISRHGRSLSNV